MSSNESENERYEMLVNGDIHKVIPRLAVPTIISMMVSAIYNMADTFFVSQLGTSASGAVGIIFSAMAIIQALSFTWPGVWAPDAMRTGNALSLSRFLPASSWVPAWAFSACSTLTRL